MQLAQSQCMHDIVKLIEEHSSVSVYVSFDYVILYQRVPQVDVKEPQCS